VPQFNLELRTENRVWETMSVEMADVTALRIELARFVGQLLKDHAKEIWVDEEWRVDATDEDGLILFMIQILATNSPATLSFRDRR